MLQFFTEHKRNQGVITIFLLIILMPTLVFGTFILELGRYRISKTLLDDSVDATITSLMADYNKILYEEFGLFAYNEQDDEKRLATFKEYLEYNSNLSADINGDVAPAISQLYKLDQVDLIPIYSLASKTVMTRQIQEYSKYRMVTDLPGELFDFEELKKDLIKKLTGGMGDKWKKIEKGMKVVTSFVDILDDIITLSKVTSKLENYINGPAYVNELKAAYGDTEVTEALSEEKIFTEPEKDATNFVKLRSELKANIEKKEKFIVDHNLVANDIYSYTWEDDLGERYDELQYIVETINLMDKIEKKANPELKGSYNLYSNITGT